MSARPPSRGGCARRGSRPLPSAALDAEVPIWRLHALRLACLAYIAGAFSGNLPHLFVHAPAERGVLTSIFAGLWVMALLALRSPLRLMPLFLFEFAWKSIWTVCFGLPQWWSGTGSPRLGQDLFEVGLFAVLTGLVIPWGFVRRHYLAPPADRWR